MTADSPADRPIPTSRREWRAQNADLSFETPAAHDDGVLTILAVCTGNICRSPMAEVVLRERLKTLDVRVHSAGTHALVGHEMTEPAQALAVESGAEADAAARHTARYLVEPMLVDADLVLTMTRGHRSHAVKMVPSTVRRTFTVREFARLAAQLSTSDARAAADLAGSAPKARFAAVLQAIADRRVHAAGVDPQGDDVIDPYRRSQATYVQAASELIPALDEVERIVRAAVG